MVLAGLLMALAAGAAEPPPPKTVAPVTVQAPAPTTIEKHPDAIVNSAGGSDEAIGEYVAVWPGRAYHGGKDGRVSLNCLIDVHGLAEWCKVAAETPPGLGFGRAALELRTTFKLKPAQGPDGAPVAKVMSVNVGFKQPDFQFDAAEFERELRAHHSSNAGRDIGDMAPVDIPYSGNRLDLHRLTMIDDPEWVAAPDFDDVAAAYPAQGGGIEGYAAMHCQVVRGGKDAGRLRYCESLKEDPHGREFAHAALSLMGKFRIRPESLAHAPQGAPLWVDVPVRLPPPKTPADRMVAAPVWLVNVDPALTWKVFPKAAAARGLTRGVGQARCQIAVDGGLANCTPEGADPDGAGFPTAAAQVAPLMRMNLWSADGGPVEGGAVEVSLEFRAKGG